MPPTWGRSSGASRKASRPSTRSSTLVQITNGSYHQWFRSQMVQITCSSTLSCPSRRPRPEGSHPQKNPVRDCQHAQLFGLPSRRATPICPATVPGGRRLLDRNAVQSDAPSAGKEVSGWPLSDVRVHVVLAIQHEHRRVELGQQLRHLTDGMGACWCETTLPPPKKRERAGKCRRC